MNNFSSPAPPPPLFPGTMASQDYLGAQFSTTSTPPTRPLMERPRFGFHAPSPYPRPRSSASKPNPGSGFDSIHEESENYFPSSNYSFPSPINEQHYSQNTQNQSQDSSSFGNSSFNDYPSYNDSYDFKNPSYDNMSYTDSYNKPDMTSYDSKPGMAYSASLYEQQDLTYSKPNKKSNNRFSNTSNNSYSSQSGDSSYATCPEGSFTSPNYNFYGNQREQPTTKVSKKWGTGSQFSNTRGTRRNYKGKNATSFGNRTQQFSSYDGQTAAEGNQDVQRPMKRKAPELHLRCELCGIGFTSQIPFEMHLTGAKHMKKQKAIEILKLLQSQGHAGPGDTENKVFHCEVCNVDLNGALQVQTHYDGNKHKQKVKALEPPGDVGNQNGQQQASVASAAAVMTTKPKIPNQDPSTKVLRLSCDTCNITVNSEMQLQQHLTSKKHQAKVEGKPLPARKKRKSGSNTSAADDDIVPIGRASAGNNIPKVMSIPDIKANFVKAENTE